MNREARKLRRGRVYVITYRCTTPGPDVDEGTIEALYTGEIDTVGKRTFRPLDGQAPYYLFDRELISVDPY